jgi:glyoxylase-like metal-dependent hydrolase (beta-lactamase superfamily II)
MHGKDIGPWTKDVEFQLEGAGTWALRLLEDDDDDDGDVKGISVAVTTVRKARATTTNAEEEEEEEEELLLIHTPGHTAGCVSLLFRWRGRGRAAGAPGPLFTGDHLARESARKQQQRVMSGGAAGDTGGVGEGGGGGSSSLSPHLTAFPGYNWHDWQLQRASVAKLVGLDFTAVLPGHGRRALFPRGVGEKDAALRELLRAEP